MQKPAFEHQSHAGEATTGKGHIQAETINLKETTMLSNEKPLPAAVQERIEAFKSAKTVFLDWQSKYNDLQTKAQNQTALAEAAEAEAGQYKEALRGVVRDMVRSETGDKETVNTLAAKLQLTESLAAEHRAFAADLLAEAETLKLHGLIAADDYRKSREHTVKIYIDFQFKEILSGIEEQVFRAVGIKGQAYRILGLASDEGNAIDKALKDATEYFKAGISEDKIYNVADESLDMLTMPLNIRPFKVQDIGGFDVIKARQKLRQAQE